MGYTHSISNSHHYFTVLHKHKPCSVCPLSDSCVVFDNKDDLRQSENTEAVRCCSRISKKSSSNTNNTSSNKVTKIDSKNNINLSEPKRIRNNWRKVNRRIGLNMNRRREWGKWRWTEEKKTEGEARHNQPYITGLKDFYFFLPAKIFQVSSVF